MAMIKVNESIICADKRFRSYRAVNDADLEASTFQHLHAQVTFHRQTGLRDILALPRRNCVILGKSLSPVKLQFPPGPTS